MSPDTYPKPVKDQPHPFRAWWVRYAGSVAFMTMIFVVIIVFWKTESAIDDLRRGNIAACEQGNEQRKAERQSRRASIEQAKAFDPKILFPDSDPAYINRLTRQTIQDERAAIQANQDVDCEARYPDMSVLSFVTN